MNSFFIIAFSILISALSVIANAQTQENGDKTFDEEGRLVQEIDDQGQLVYYIYDDEGELVAKHYEDGTVVLIKDEQ